MSAPALEFDRATFSYGRIPVLREVSFAIPEGTFVAILGANGSGKTTLMRMGLGLLRPTHGTVRLFGTPIARFREWWKVGYIPQRAAMTGPVPVSVEEVVRSGLVGRPGTWRRPGTADRERMSHVIDVMDLAPLRKEPLSHLSGGQQQRALIARALVTGPRLLILDEPTTGVDAGSRAALRDSLDHLVRHDGVTVAYVTHDPEGFAGLADRVVELRAGHVVDCADPTAHLHAHPPHEVSMPPDAGEHQR